MKTEFDREALLFYSNLIIKNIEDIGWERYDPVDLRYLPLANKGIWIRKFILILEMYMPVYMRKILKIKKKSYPTAYSFVAGAYEIFERCGIPIQSKQTSIQVIEKCLEKYVTTEGGDIWWNYYKNKVLYPDDSRSERRPTMCLHFIARCNQVLFAIGKLYNRKDLIDISKKTLDKTLDYHEIIQTEENQESICYYYNSRESTINVNSEMLEWMALYDNTSKYSDHIQKILNMILANQQEDGSWNYFSIWHKENISNTLGGIDAHHTATIIYNLIHYAELEKKKDLHEVIISINKGMEFFLKKFFNPLDGEGKVVLGKRRVAGPVQYAESVIALIDYIKSPIDFDKLIRKNAEEILPKIMKQMLSLVNESDGSVPSDKIIKRIHLDSIRWGNGPVLFAIAKYMEFCQVYTW